MRTPKLLIYTAACLAALSGSAGYAQDDLGENVYSQYCATCHGASGTGDGPLTELMTTKVSDLTVLKENNDGVFPMLEVIHIIDGRTGLRGHGGPMPVYGAVFNAEAGDIEYGSVVYTRAKILSLAYYLESIQK
ncbi:c-type cytochrome [Yoonia sediminilitoris]|uniref:Cbb3-type cytochrome c oxidase subunit III n=1 Tax=Yoonia sediminilitoris TaxID=1286148 RepID=A0A2T6K8F6_9RHOB|nr:c-type cytochrome [Yoonia sediminilitoris]PUB11031.1 cbb3-type cytochrome c oxidase subunit III [Yoonia sediminilitoris]RCW90950.1 cbb3-type cytochrome c oxidase subunit III [Yoonia sediminilitoris]